MQKRNKLLSFFRKWLFLNCCKRFLKDLCERSKIPWMQAVARPLWKMHSVIYLWNDKSCKDIFPTPAVSGCFWCLYMQGYSLRQRFVVTRLFRSSNRRCSVKSVLRNFAKFTKKNTCAGVSFLITLQVSSLKLY